MGDGGAVVEEAIIVEFCCLRACSFWKTGPSESKISSIQWHGNMMPPCHCIELIYKELNTISAIEHARGEIGSIFYEIIGTEIGSTNAHRGFGRSPDG